MLVICTTNTRICHGASSVEGSSEIASFPVQLQSPNGNYPINHVSHVSSYSMQNLYETFTDGSEEIDSLKLPV